MKAIMSIKPKYADAIMNGTKKVEYRKQKMKQKVEKVYVYSTYPVKKVIGHFVIGKIQEKHPLDLWLETWDRGCVEIGDYQEYFRNKEKAFAYEIKSFVKYDEPVELFKIDGVGRPPQSFKYVKEA